MTRKKYKPYRPTYNPTQLCRDVFQALWEVFDKSGTYHNSRSRNIIGGATYEVGSNDWYTTFRLDDNPDWPPYKRLQEHLDSGRLRCGDLLTGSERGALVIRGKTVEIAKKVMREKFGMELLDVFEIGLRVYYLWVKGGRSGTHN